MVQLQRSTKFTGICFLIYITYGIFVFFILPMLMPDPVTMQRNQLNLQMQKFGNLSNYTLATEGTPVRSLFVTFKGSGAIEFLDNLSSQPGCYHHFAPLIGNKRRIDKEEVALKALNELVALFNCDYSQSGRMLDVGSRARIFRYFYGHQRSICMTYSRDICWNRDTLTGVCKVYPFINMSVYNLGLKYLAMLLKREDLNIRIVFLVRDPRGTMYSRYNQVWCTGDPNCEDPRFLCKDMVDEYKIAEELRQKYPTRFRIIRFEELTTRPLQNSMDLFKFYGLPIHIDAEELEKEKKQTGSLRAMVATEDASLNNNVNLPFQWLDDLNPDQIKLVQNACSEAMRLWGYRQFESWRNSTQAAASFNPVVQPAPLSV
ncbi:carbohydrate sulfotransferase 5 [Scaptodrosophila lebanonensis]|uniref:Carbohydrate sulfotransferase 5 n=1 Tax=Drosophila lebanonensis TaxID=7225 RepID=A0A6J2TNJ1_DROLE|nr:carbohydrate sulfotransferase 5 [Scaptodrosophila lebanonensis]